MRIRRRQQPAESVEATLVRLRGEPSGHLFPVVKLREGYDMDAVDRALDDWEQRARKAAPG